MTDEYEWGPWIAHDGTRCPLRNGVWVHFVEADGEESVGEIEISPPAPHEIDIWDWTQCHERGRWYWRIIRYRVRKPRALTELRAMVEALPAPKPQEVDA